MAAVLLRVVLMAGGLGLTEIGLGDALTVGSLSSWALVMVGLALIVGGSGGFMAALLGGGIGNVHRPMRKPVSSALAIGVLLSLATSTAVMAHKASGAEEVIVEPSAVTAGDAVILVGSGLEPNAERILALAGGGLVVDLGSVTPDAEGMFRIKLTIPSHLPSGIYELRAIGDESGIEAWSAGTVLALTEAGRLEDARRARGDRHRTAGLGRSGRRAAANHPRGQVL